MPTSRYNWAGDMIVPDTIVQDKRAVLGYENVYIPTDIREWISSSDNEAAKRALREIDLPAERVPGTFDERAFKIWKYVAEKIEYVQDKVAMGMPDFWQFPAETLTLQKGDCEDTSFLLASLMHASGISDYCVRVVLGRIISSIGSFGHAWVVYQNEEGIWSLMESTMDKIPSQVPAADALTEPGVKYQYQPQFCLNRSHLWWIASVKMSIAEYVKVRETKKKFERSEDDLSFADDEIF